MKTETPHDLFFDQLLDLLSMEGQLAEAIPRLPELCHDAQLTEMLEAHAIETALHRAVVLQILEDHGVPTEMDECKAIAGLIDGGEKHLQAVEHPLTRDLMMIAHCLRVQHYQIAAYEITSRLADCLLLPQEAGLLQSALRYESAFAADLLALQPRLFETAQQGS